MIKQKGSQTLVTTVILVTLGERVWLWNCCI